MARFVLHLTAGLVITACESESPWVQTLSGVTITVTPAELTLAVGASASLAATVRDLEGRLLADREIRWSSSAPKIVTVTSNGVVTALDVGTASIGAYSDQGVGFARAVVQMGFRVPLRRWLLMTEMGTSTPVCPGNEGGVRRDGGRDCSHAGISRFSLDFAADQRDGSPTELPATQVFAAADGVINDICLRPPTEVTCGRNGPFVQVEHRGGFLTIYAHLDPASVTLRRKTPVAQGQPLGTMGSWGADPTPWVHFELRHENLGAGAESVLGSVELDGRKFRDYIVSPHGSH